MRQCTCGRTNTPPYCDNTHKTKKEVTEQENNLEQENK